jgi:hypothetical protein
MPLPRSLRRTLLLTATLVASSAAHRAARGDVTESCVAAYEKFQQLRQEGKLGASREQLVQCLQPGCPNVVKKDCSQWLTELDAMTPTVIVKARNAAGKDVLTVRVLVDGAVLMDSLDGKPHAIDPGVHVFRYENGGDAMDERIVIQEGEKNRVVTAQFAPQRALPAQTPTAPVAPHTPPRSATVGYALLGAGVAGAAGFVAFAALGQHDLSEMRKDKSDGGCAPDCDQSRVDSARTKIVVADVCLGMGLVAAGLGTFILLKPQSATATGLQVGVRPSAGGAMTDFAYRF